eukprot:4442777-Prymnesium_polylepis.1
MILTGSTRALIVLRTSSPLTYVRMTYAVRATSDIQIWSFRISPLSCADATRGARSADRPARRVIATLKARARRSRAVVR